MQVPSGLLPVLEVDGQVITESAVIQQVGCCNLAGGLLERVMASVARSSLRAPSSNRWAAGTFRGEGGLCRRVWP